MEKFRKHADAATGINPFVPTSSPLLPVTAVLNGILLPVRVVLLLVFGLLLFLLDVVMHFLRIASLASVASLLLFPLQTFIGQAFLMCLLSIQPKLRLLTPKRSALNPQDDGITSPVAGDVVLSNLVTAFDACFYGSLSLHRSDGDNWRIPFVMVAIYSPIAPHLAVFGPSPLQRWKVMRYLLHTTSDAFLEKCTAASKVEDVELDVAPLQARARQLGVPIVLFPEGTPSNGKAVLQWPQTFQFDPKQKVSICTVTYTGPIATQRGTSSMMSVGSWLLRAWLSTPSTVFVTLARPGNGPQPLTSTGKQDAEWVLETRQRVAFAVEYRQAGNHVCKVVKLQVQDKAAFAVHFRETMVAAAKPKAAAAVEAATPAPSPSTISPALAARIRKAQ